MSLRTFLSRFKGAPVSWGEGVLVGSIGGAILSLLFPAWISLFLIFLLVLWTLVGRGSMPEDMSIELERGRKVMVRFDALVFGLSTAAAALLALVLIRTFVCKTPLF